MHNSEPEQEKLLILSRRGAGGGEVPAGAELADSPLRFLDAAVDRVFSRFVVVADVRVAGPGELIELCAILRRNTRTRATPLLGILLPEQVELAAELSRVGVRHIWVTDAAAGEVHDQLSRLDREFLKSIERHTGSPEGPCPYINYNRIGVQQEIRYCGAYRNRLVLGRYLLDHYCLGPDYIDCEYYQAPKPAE